MISASSVVSDKKTWGGACDILFSCEYQSQFQK